LKRRPPLALSAPITSPTFCGSSSAHAANSRRFASAIRGGMNSSQIRYRCWLTMPSFFSPKRNPMIPLEQKLLDLNLTVMSHRLETTLSEAAGKNLSAAATLEWLADMELEARRGRAIERRFKCSKLPAQPSIDAFHFAHHKSRSQNKNRILRLLDLSFIANGTNLVLIGNPGVGKTFLSKIVGWRACQSNQRVLFTTAMDMLNHWLASQVDHSLVRKLRAYTEPALLIGDELGYLALDPQSSNLFYQVISTRHSQKRSSIITTHTPFSDWGNILFNTTIATAIADRLVENSEIFWFGGDSLRKANKNPNPPAE
jgi:DNA replication protein DnaC